MRILVVGPSPTRSKGGMATVIEEIEKDKTLNSKFNIDIYESYIDGNKLKVLFFSLFSFIRFYFTKRYLPYTCSFIRKYIQKRFVCSCREKVGQKSNFTYSWC